MIKKYKALSERLTYENDVILIEQLKQEYIQEQERSVGKSLGFATMATLVYFILQWLMMTLFMGSMGKKSENIKMSKRLREITSDPNVTIWKVHSKEVNAFNAGGSQLYYFTGLVKQLKLTDGELMAIMLHEYGHYKGKHVLKMQLAIYPSYFIFTFIFKYLTKVDSIESAFMAILPLNIIMKIYGVTFGRRHETESDRAMVEYGHKKEALSAFKKLYMYVRKEVCGQMDIPSSSKECKNIIKELHALDEHPDFETRIDNISNTKMIKMLSAKIMSKLKNILPLLK